MWIDIQMGPIVMWAWYLLWAAFYFALLAVGAICMRDCITKAKKMNFVGWLSWSMLMLWVAVRYSNRVAFWCCQAWPNWCG